MSSSRPSSPSTTPRVASAGGDQSPDRVVPVEVLRARAFLLRVAEPPSTALGGLIRRVGPVAAAGMLRDGEVPGIIAPSTSAGRVQDQADSDLDAAAAVGARLLVPESPDWPTEVFSAFDRAPLDRLQAPIGLWVRGPGHLASLAARSVTVVGSRNATQYGVHAAGELGSALATAGVPVVSGAAFGVDAAAHRGALAAGGPTLAVLACGVCRVYPATHASLLERITASALIVSEYPPGATPTRTRFLVRDRLQAALGNACVVVEAATYSGSMRTAADAAALGRPVLAVPGPCSSAMSAGPHRLIREGAILAASSQDVLDVLDAPPASRP